MLGYDENGNIDWNEIADMEYEQAQGTKDQILERMKEQEKQAEEMTDQEHFDMKADLDYDQMIDDSLTD
ncbi:MAG: hypothetical protein ABEI32_12400 [Halothece sp.]|jgi:hypothetical protein